MQRHIGLIVIAGCSLSAAAIGQTADQHGLEGLQEAIEARLTWEILWGDSPEGFRAPDRTPVPLAVQVTSDDLSFCSHTLGMCARYRLHDGKLTQRLSTREVAVGDDDKGALTDFDGPPYTQAIGQTAPYIGRDGFLGLATNFSIQWTAIIHLADRLEIIDKYKSLRPDNLSSLGNWLRTTIPPTSGYNTITIPCFALTDPEIVLVGERSSGFVAFAVFWNDEIKQWTEASILRDPEDRAQIMKLKNIAASITCATLTFKAGHTSLRLGAPLRLR